MIGGPSEADDAVVAADPGESGGEVGEGAGETSAGAQARKPRRRRKLIVLLVGVVVVLVELGFSLSNWVDPPCKIIGVNQGGVGGTLDRGSGGWFSSFSPQDGVLCDIPRRGPITAVIVAGYDWVFDGSAVVWDMWKTPIYTATLNIGEDVCFVHPVRSDWDVYFDGETPGGEPVTIEYLSNEAAYRCEYSGNPDSKNLWAYYLAEEGEVQSGDMVRVWMENDSQRSVFAEISIR